MFAVCKQWGMTQKPKTPLRLFLEITETPQAALADQVGVSRSYMNQIVSGIKTPRLKVAVAIERATGGHIKASSLVVGASQ